ncbi:MAG: hypothetical protein AAF602_01640, partial [Myxococcota bacterium]
DETWTLESTPGGTRARRRFLLRCRGRLSGWLVRTVLAPQFREAMRRHHATLGRRLGGSIR